MRRHDGVASGARGGTAYAMTVAGRPEPLTLVITKRIDGPRVADEVLRAALPLALAAGLAVSLLLALLVSGGLLRRLGRLQDDAEALGSEGLSHAVRTGGHDEVAVVARALEAMRGRLVEEQAARARFVSTASHELRTPLSSLVLTLELLREEIDRGTPSIERADTALRQTHRLTALATDLLDISRTDSGPDLRLEPLELAELATGVADEFLPRLESLGRGVHVEGDSARALADAAAATRILRVLLDNAASYGAGQVVVSVRPEPGCVRLSVEDEGSGVGDDERERVFGRFTRGRAAGATHGAGLGLAIARALARAMNGDLEATGGARIVLSLPAA
jgi:signal transduction histidine kinase